MHRLEPESFVIGAVLRKDYQAIGAPWNARHGQLLTTFKDEVRQVVVPTVHMDKEKVDIGPDEVTLDHGLQVQIFLVLHREVLVVEHLVLILFILRSLDLNSIGSRGIADKVSQVQLIIHQVVSLLPWV